MRKILLLIPKLEAGGAERNACLLANKWVEDGYSVTIAHLMPSSVFYSLSPKVSVVDLSKKGVSKPFFYLRRRLRSLQKSEHFDVVVSFFFTVGAFAWLCLPHKKIRFIVRETGNPKSRKLWKRLLCAAALRHVDHVVFQTSFEMSCYPKKLQKKGVIIRNPVVLPSYTYSNPVSSHLWISSGRLVEDKDHKTLITAFSLFLKDDPKARLEIYGEGPLRDSLQKQIDVLGLSRNVFLQGVTPDIFKTLNQAFAFVLPSRNEGMPNALLEAKVFGVPVISSNWSGNESVCQNNEDCLVFQQGDANDLYQKMVLLSSLSTRESLRLNAQQQAFLYSIDSVAKSWEKIIDC
jgi:GalNAc-alpha-(1->4)-GalNAc-alpha-(1->3)-diNAcBac-PP-undecaprenol alpha-1,4-N-acetyl-D-galactosaminyltransferase